MSDEPMNANRPPQPPAAPQPEGGHPQYGTPQYPDPAAPAAYPGVSAHGSAPPQYPGYTGPSPYQQDSIASPGPGGLAIAALVVGIVAFLMGWVPIVGLILGIVGIVLGILALRQPRGKALGITGLVLSGLAALTGVFMLLLTFVWLPMLD